LVRDRRVQGEVAALLVAHGKRLQRGEDAAALHGEAVGRVVEQAVAATLRFETERKGGVAGDGDRRDVVHLDGDVERHGASGESGFDLAAPM